MPDIVIDTCVFVSALRSKRGASYKLFMSIGTGVFDISISVPLIIEYEAAAKRLISEIQLAAADIEDITDYLCAVAKCREVFYLWRPLLKDPTDDMVLELAVVSGSKFIITFNKKDFAGSEKFGIKVLTPREFLKWTGGV
jgi:putative PIN family toxin of toxin-antitoxin system